MSSLLLAVWLLSALDALADPELLQYSDPARLKLRLYDLPCEESEKHTCVSLIFASALTFAAGACQFHCEDRKQCSRAVAVCEKQKDCKCVRVVDLVVKSRWRRRYVVMNPSGDWATLKRLPNEVELMEQSGYEEIGWDQRQYALQESKLLKEGARLRRQYALVGGFGLASANRSLAVASTLRGDDSTLCGLPAAKASQWLVESAVARPHDLSIALVALSYRSPATLRRSITSWLDSGLLHIVDERLAILNDPSPADLAICVRHGFDVRTPSSLVKASNTSLFRFELKTVKHDVFTIGAAFAAALLAAKSKYILFLEKDFALDHPKRSNTDIIDELAASIAALRRGAALVRLRSVSDSGCGTFRRCQDDANMPNWKAPTTFMRRRNWWSFYCEDFSRPDSVADCARGANGIHFRCFTSWDSSWSLNAVILDRKHALETRWRIPKTGRHWRASRPNARRPYRSRFVGRGLTLAEYAAATWRDQSAFEVGMLRDDWGKLRMPLCLSLRGLFTHVEVDG